MGELTIYTFGYSQDRTFDDLRELMSGEGHERFLAVDIRRSRNSRNPAWTAAGLAHLNVVTECAWEWRLGNAGKTAKWDPLVWHEAVSALGYAAQRLSLGVATVFVCAERDHTKCHRTEIAERIAAFIPGGAEVKHL